MRRLTRRLAVKAMLLLLCAAAAAPRALPVNNPGRAPQQAAPARRPLRILALGDSVMWGQGLKDENKFTYKLRDWLCGRRGNPDCQNEQDVELHVEAHSGATILEDDGKLKKLKDKFRPPGPSRKYAGEVNYSHPTLWAQLDRARSYYGSHAGEVDLVLVNGGINDVNATNILVRGLFSGNLKKRAEKYCGKEMKPFLLKVADAFPNARIVVPGYFPLITKSTPPHIVFETMWELLFRDEEGEAEEFAAFQEDWKAPPGESAAEAGVRVSKKIEWLANRSSDFVKASDAALEYAVNELNKDRPLPGASARGLFVPVEFGDHGYGTVETFLWKLGGKPRTSC